MQTLRNRIKLPTLLAALMCLLFATGFDEGCFGGLSTEEAVDVKAWCGQPTPVDRGKNMAQCHQASTLASKCWIINSNDEEKCAGYFANSESQWLRDKGFGFHKLDDGTALVVKVSH